MVKQRELNESRVLLGEMIRGLRLGFYSREVGTETVFIALETLRDTENDEEFRAQIIVWSRDTFRQNAYGSKRPKVPERLSIWWAHPVLKARVLELLEQHPHSCEITIDGFGNVVRQ